MAIRDMLLPEFDQEMANTRKLLERLPDQIGIQMTTVDRRDLNHWNALVRDQICICAGRSITIEHRDSKAIFQPLHQLRIPAPFGRNRDRAALVAPIEHDVRVPLAQIAGVRVHACNRSAALLPRHGVGGRAAAPRGACHIRR